MKFGAELEVTASVGGAASGAKGTFYDFWLELIADSGIKGWKIEIDNSCGNEIVSPILDGEKGLNALMQVCHCANKAKEAFGLNRLTGPDCGIHFHFDANKLNHRQIRNVLVITAMAETLFYAMNPTSRFGTNFAAPLNFNLFQCIRARDIVDLRDLWFRSYMGVDAHQDSFRNKNREYYPAFINSEKKKPQKYDWTRYHGMNFLALFKHGTIEFRYAHGSFNLHTVEMWYRLFEAIMKAATEESTRTILKSNFPFTMNKVKLHSLPSLQRTLYSDLRRVIKFLFDIQKGSSRSLIEPTVPLMKFMTERLMKFHNTCISKPSYKKILEMDDSVDNARKILALVLEKKMTFPHGGFIHNQPEHHLE